MKEVLPEWFEKDYLLQEDKQRSWDDLQVGEEYDTVPFVLTEERIRLYVEGTDDYNPVYLNEEEAKKSVFKGKIAPPTIVAPIMFAVTHPNLWIKMPGAINPGQKLEFGVPARAGDTIYGKCTLVDKYIKRNKKYAIGQAKITNQNGELICIWTGGLILPR